MLQKHQSPSSLALFFNSFFLINLTFKVLKQVAAKPGIWGQAKFFILQPFGICIAALLKYRKTAQKATTTQFIQDNSGLQVLYLSFVFKIHLRKDCFQIPCSGFQPTKCKLWGLPVSKYWNLESAFPEGLLEHILVLLTLMGPLVLAFIDISRSLVTWDLFTF